MEIKKIEYIRELADKYNDPSLFMADPIIFPKHFQQLMLNKRSTIPLPVPDGYAVSLKDVEISAVFAAHLAWGRREMIVRDIKRALDEMSWKPLEYINKGDYRSTDESLHRTIKWCEFASICKNLRDFYSKNDSLESLSPDEMRVEIYGQKSNHKMANKKIHLLRRWMVRDDGCVDLGLWKSILPKDLIIPLDVHVHTCALEMGITKRKCADIVTAIEITEYLKQCFPNDPVKGDFALFAHTIEQKNNKKRE